MHTGLTRASLATHCSDDSPDTMLGKLPLSLLLDKSRSLTHTHEYTAAPHASPSNTLTNALPQAHAVAYHSRATRLSPPTTLLTKAHLQSRPQPHAT
jgi:hypothetical protein